MMDPGLHTPLIDLLKRREIPREACLLAARGVLAPRALEQLVLLAILSEDADAEVRSTAEATLAGIPSERLGTVLGRSDAPEGLRVFFRGRGIEPIVGAAAGDEPLVDAEPGGQADESAEGAATRLSAAQRLTVLGVAERMKVAMKGSKEERAILIRDPNKLVSTSVLSSPKISESEIESFAKAGSVSEEVLRIIAMNRRWTKNYAVMAALTKNPKTPLSLSLHFVQRLSSADLKSIAMDRNLQEPLKLAVRKRMMPADKR